MINYKTFIAGEDINNLDICYLGNDYKLYNRIKEEHINENLVFVNEVSDIIPISRGDLVRGVHIILTAQHKL